MDLLFDVGLLLSLPKKYVVDPAVTIIGTTAVLGLAGVAAIVWRGGYFKKEGREPDHELRTLPVISCKYP